MFEENDQLSDHLNSPVNSRKSVLSDKTDITEPRCKQWWKKLDEDTKEVLDALENDKFVKESECDIMEVEDVSVQSSQSYSIELPESSDNESVHSIILTRRPLLLQGKNRRTINFNSKVAQDSITAENLTEADDTIIVKQKKLLNQGSQKQANPTYPDNPLKTLSSNKMTDKTITTPVIETKVSKLFGNKRDTRKENIFAQLDISVDTQDEIPAIEPQVHKLFGNQINHEIDMFTNVCNTSNLQITSGDKSILNKTTELVVPNNKKTQKLLNKVDFKRKNMFFDLNLSAELCRNTPEKSLMNNSEEMKTPVAEQNLLRRKYDNQNIFAQIHDLLDPQLSPEKSITNLTSEVDSLKTKLTENTHTINDHNNFDMQQQPILNESNKDGTTVEQIDRDALEVDAKKHENMEIQTVKEKYQHQDTIPVSELKGFEVEPIQNYTENFGKVIPYEDDKMENAVDNEHEENVRENKYSLIPYTSEKNKIENDKTVENSALRINNEREENLTRMKNAENIAKDKNSMDNLTDEQEQSDDEIDNESVENLAEDENTENLIKHDNFKDSLINEQDQTEDGSLAEISVKNTEGDDNRLLNIGLKSVKEINIPDVIKKEISIMATNNINYVKESDKQNDFNINSDKLHSGEQVDEQKQNWIITEDSTKENCKNLHIKAEILVANNHKQNVLQQTNEFKIVEDNMKNRTDIEDDDEMMNISDVEEYLDEKQSSDDNYAEITNENDEEISIGEQIHMEDEHKIIPSMTYENELNKKSGQVKLSAEGQHQQNPVITGRFNANVSRNNCSDFQPSFEPIAESTGAPVEVSKNSTVERSAWDSHRTTRKTLRQTFGKDFTPRKSLRTLVMERSAKIRTVIQEKHQHTGPLANSTELADNSLCHNETLQKETKLLLQKMRHENIQRFNKIKQNVLDTIAAKPVYSGNVVKLADGALSNHVKSKAVAKPKNKSNKQPKSITVPLHTLPPGFVEDLQYKPPKLFKPKNASWINKRLYNYLQSALQPRYGYKARVRAERLVEELYEFTKETKKLRVANIESVIQLKSIMARLGLVRTHHDFYHFFRLYLPMDIRCKVNPNLENDIPVPANLFENILQE